jgi:hypothetical protein
VSRRKHSTRCSGFLGGIDEVHPEAWTGGFLSEIFCVRLLKEEERNVLHLIFEMDFLP